MLDQSSAGGDARAPGRISIAAGITIASIADGLGPHVRVVRVMPNTPALIGEGASAFALGPRSSPGRRGARPGRFWARSARSFASPSRCSTPSPGLSGSGPAFVYLMIEALSDGGVRAGLPRDVATLLAAQTVLGAAKMVRETGEHPGVLKDQVASPGGTTIAGLHALERAGVRGALDRRRRWRRRAARPSWRRWPAPAEHRARDSRRTDEARADLRHPRRSRRPRAGLVAPDGHGRRPDRLRRRPGRLRPVSRPGRRRSCESTQIASVRGNHDRWALERGLGVRDEFGGGTPGSRDARLPDAICRSICRSRSRPGRRGRPRLAALRHGVRQPPRPSRREVLRGYLAELEVRPAGRRPHAPADVVSLPRAGWSSIPARSSRSRVWIRRGRSPWSISTSLDVTFPRRREW